jgi:hypothetical protein
MSETIALHTIFELMRATGARAPVPHFGRRRLELIRRPRPKACRSPATSARTTCT